MHDPECRYVLKMPPEQMWRVRALMIASNGIAALRDSIRQVPFSSIQRAPCQNADCAASSDDFPPPSPPAEKANAREDKSGKSSTGDGPGGRGIGDRYSCNEI
jgi:hypothetical protein